MSLSYELALTLLAGPITALFTVILQSSHTNYVKRKRILNGLIDELQINHEMLDNSSNLGSTDTKWKNLKLHNESYTAFIRDGYLDLIDIPMKNEIGSLYTDINVINQLNSDVDGSQIPEINMKMSCLASKDYLERYMEKMGYNNYLNHAYVKTIRFLKRINVKTRFKYKSKFKDSGIVENVDTGYPSVEVKYDNLFYYPKTQNKTVSKQSNHK